MLSVVGKLHGKVLIKRVRDGTECAIGEEQCGFSNHHRSTKSTAAISTYRLMKINICNDNSSEVSTGNDIALTNRSNSNEVSTSNDIPLKQFEATAVSSAPVMTLL